ncbi:tRNA uridine-5-carboxymethylaminomethyl(34) synthesis GTPase MnmE [Silanimonas sp.]|jgi:tRNA modification GTPase|uniref:tRNA uridine-5-carboxymethylaminomethyl(34) synthesis GTPase MnmE n=1 Tax=Silanimonas sp. TaxID=1929290 RepID=UPI0037C56E08
MSERDTIVAVATANGAAGIGVVRLSGPQAKPIAQALCAVDRPFVARQARYARFRDADGEVIDDGLVIAFDAPRSFTGEDVVELQGHGNPRLLAQVAARCFAFGARAARPGEFSERAFLEGKLDLAQAEAVADLITASSDAALRAARRSLDGVFSARVDELVEALTLLRVHVEAAIDFPEEEIDFLAAPELTARLAHVEALHGALHRDAARGVRLVDGLHVVIVGAPNAGKSALMNALAGAERAIVTPIAGTTRDVLREVVRVDGVELTLVDTAGLRETQDVVEAEGIRRARAEVAKADLVLAVLDDREAEAAMARLREELRVSWTDLGAPPAILWLHTHADLTGAAGNDEHRDDGRHLWIDTPRGIGLDGLRAALRDAAGANVGAEAVGAFSARARHVDAIVRAGTHLAEAAAQLRARQGELAAEDLRLAQDALGEITGRVSSDALLGRIFSSFCIGK